MSEGFAALDPCVHCGFCLPACPTYNATGDEADSPRGRIVLMRALERKEIPASDPALREHLDACLGCRGCEPVCPSGVEYGRGLETARAILAARNGLGLKAQTVLAIFRRRWLWGPLFSFARLLRNSGAPRRMAGPSGTGFSMGMLAATTPPKTTRRLRARSIPTGETVLLFRGCVMDRLFAHVHAATRRTLEANGYRVLSATLPHCCGALHAHAGEVVSARSLATANLNAMGPGVDHIVVNSAGCGAMLKDYGHLVGGDGARAFSAKVRDVTELLAAAGPRAGAPLELRVAYDAPCHLQHAQRVHGEVLRVLDAVPKMVTTLLPDSDQCCGSAGIFSLVQPAMSQAVLARKINTIAEAAPRPDLVATGNPGCLMQIGAGLLAAGLDIPVAHPVELLDWSYEKAGLYQ